MKYVLGVPALLCAVACGNPDASADAATDSVPADTGVGAAVPSVTRGVLPDSIDYPRSQGGQLVARGVGAAEFEHAWPARAVRCTDPSMLFLFAERDRSGGSVLLQLPAEGDLVGVYPIVLVEGGVTPDPPAAQLGFQFFENQPAAYQGQEGAVEIYGFAARVSGRFRGTIRHIVTNQVARVAGIFHNVQIEPPPDQWCERAAAARDSVAGGGG